MISIFSSTRSVCRLCRVACKWVELVSIVQQTNAFLREKRVQRGDYEPLQITKNAVGVEPEKRYYGGALHFGGKLRGGGSG